MPTSTAASMRGRIAAYTRWSRATAEDRARQREHLERGWKKRFEDQVDPDRTLSPTERTRRAHAAMRAEMLRLSLAAAKSKKAAGAS